METAYSVLFILALFDIQSEDGFIPHMAKPYEISSVTQPPVIAWGAYTVYKKSGNKEFLKTVFPLVNIDIHKCLGLCSYYAEVGGLLIGYEG